MQANVQQRFISTLRNQGCRLLLTFAGQLATCDIRMNTIKKRSTRACPKSSCWSGACRSTPTPEFEQHLYRQASTASPPCRHTSSSDHPSTYAARALGTASARRCWLLSVHQLTRSRPSQRLNLDIITSFKAVALSRSLTGSELRVLACSRILSVLSCV